jgi:catechol 2,3-dioxygenase-like lactoylglutathione lyase family enzyme
MKSEFRMTRRQMLLTLPALAIAPKVWAQTASRAPIQAKFFNHFMLGVSDVQRSIDFYQGLFGMPIQARQGSAVLLRVGNGPQYLGLSPAGSNPPSITQFGLAIDNFNADRVVQALLEHGVTKASASDPGPAGGPMKVRQSMRGATPEVFLGDPDGLIVQLQDSSYCGGSGPMGAVCSSVEPSSKKGLLAVKNMSHATIQVTDAQRTQDFYQAVFGVHVQGHQAPAGSDASPFYGIGAGPQFLMFTGGAPARGAGAPGAAGGGAGRGAGGGGAAGAGAAAGGGRAGGGAAGAGRAGAGAAGGRGAAAGPRPPRIDHICMSMDGFNPDTVTKALNSYGIKTQAQGEPRGPMMTYISMRMPNRGGAESGTPELYFLDPDGLSIQLQDTTYCGGGGFLGEVCTPQK